MGNCVACHRAPATVDAADGLCSVSQQGLKFQATNDQGPAGVPVSPPFLKHLLSSGDSLSTFVDVALRTLARAARLQVCYIGVTSSDGLVWTVVGAAGEAATLVDTYSVREVKTTGTFIHQASCLPSHAVKLSSRTAPADLVTAAARYSIEAFSAVGLQESHGRAGIFCIVGGTVSSVQCVEWTDVWITLANLAVLARKEQVFAALDVVSKTFYSTTVEAGVKALLSGIPRLFSETLMLHGLSVRVALLSQDESRATIYEFHEKKRRSLRVQTDILTTFSQAQTNRALSGDTANLTTWVVKTKNTILAHSLSLVKTQVGTELRMLLIPNCTHYGQLHSPVPPDLFLSDTEKPIMSMMVIPIQHGGVNIGGIYLTFSTEVAGKEVKNLMKFLSRLLGRLLAQLTATMHSTEEHMLLDTWDQTLVVEGTVSSSIHAEEFNENNDHEGDKDILMTSQSHIDKDFALQHTIRHALVHQTSQQNLYSVGRVSSVRLLQLLGQGGCSQVFKGEYQGRTVAVKVIEKQDSFRHNLEFAVQQSLWHPNILKVYKMFPNITKVESRQGQDVSIYLWQGAPESAPQLQAGERSKLCTVHVLEYCDRGSLRRAVRKGLFQTSDETGKVVQRDLYGMLLTLLEIASAMEHVHGAHILHADLNDRRGFSTRLADFGMAKLLNHTHLLPNSCMGGTITHVAPEVLQPNEPIGMPADVYSYGILMWQLYTSQSVYKDLDTNEVVFGVLTNKLRPEFPPGSPEDLVTLSKQCWHGNPKCRPTFSEIVTRLNNMLNAVAPTKHTFTADRKARGDDFLFREGRD